MQLSFLFSKLGSLPLYIIIYISGRGGGLQDTVFADIKDQYNHIDMQNIYKYNIK